MLINDLHYFKRSVNYCSKTSGIDHPNLSCRTSKDWHTYPIQNFDYQFNSWGFRGPEYEQYIGKPVNICLGDSFTVNVGGPIEHSWCSQLAEHFDIPTLNLGMDGAGNDAIRLVYDRACKIFDVQNTFVMYSYFHRRLINNKFEQVVKDDSENFKYFSKHRITTTVYESALPYWNYKKTELDFLVHNNIFFFGIDNETIIDPKKYENVKGADWPTYEEYIKGITAIQPEIVNEMKLFDKKNFYYNSIKFKNRDGHHMNYKTNIVYANYFYNQWKLKNES